MTVSTYVLYSQIDSLEEFAYIAGTDYTLYFTVYEDDGVTPQDLGGATINWVLSPYGQSYNILQVLATITDLNTFEVVIPGSSTISFSGKYTHQIVIDSFYGQTYRPAQGTILIIPATPLS